MRPSEALAAHREALRQLIRRYNVAHPRVFGSVLTGQDTARCTRIFKHESLSGTTTQRPVLTWYLKTLKLGDTLIGRYMDDIAVLAPRWRKRHLAVTVAHRVLAS